VQSRIKRTPPASARLVSSSDNVPKRSWKFRQKYRSLQQLIEQRRDTQLLRPFSDIVAIDRPDEKLPNITALQRRSVLEGERGQCGVSHKPPRDLGFAYLILQEFREPLTCSDDADVGLM
jgi:hypothetical protein